MSIVNLHDRKLIQTVKVNLVILLYNSWVILYLSKDLSECVTQLRKLTEMITKDMILVPDQILQKIYLLKSHCHSDSDKVLANQAAKMAVDLETPHE